MAIRMEVLGGEALDEGDYLLVLREVGSQRLGAIRMGFAEIASVLAAFRGIRGEQPSAHIAWALTVKLAGLVLEQLVIHGYTSEDETLCLLCFRQSDRTLSVDCRASDGIALALRLDAPIMCEEHVLEHFKVEAGDATQTLGLTNEEWLHFFNENDPDIPKA